MIDGMRTPIFSEYHSAAGIHCTPQTGKAVHCRWLFGLGGHNLQRHCARHCRLLLRLLSSLDQTLLATWSEHRLRQGSGWNGEWRSLGVSVATEWWAKTKEAVVKLGKLFWFCDTAGIHAQYPRCRCQFLATRHDCVP